MEVVQVNEQINANIGECLHAPLMIAIGVNVVNANGIGTKILHLFGVSCTLFSINEGIVRNELIRNAYCC